MRPRPPYRNPVIGVFEPSMDVAVSTIVRVLAGGDPSDLGGTPDGCDFFILRVSPIIYGREMRPAAAVGGALICVTMSPAWRVVGPKRPMVSASRRRWRVV